ncbi:thioredoxin domain-containing protein [Candidatus Woesebacteria bacterium]|nr:thioredoxin domain-containing protein [Candidatus Woesebacteria bacterium]
MKQESPYSYGAFVSFFQDNFALLIVAALFFAGGFFFGSLWTENNMLRAGGGTAPTAAVPTAQQPTAPSGPTADQLNQLPKLGANEHVRGAKNPVVTLVEYSDFECPFCARFHPTTKKILEEYGDKVQLVYRYYPLSFHPNAQKAAEAAACIAKQGGNDAFWKYADAVFAKQEALGGQLNPQAITDSAQAAGVNMDTYKKCLDSGEMAAVVKADMDGGAAAGINGTPGTIVMTKDGAQELINGALPYEQVKATVEKYLN